MWDVNLKMVLNRSNVKKGKYLPGVMPISCTTLGPKIITLQGVSQLE